MEENEEIRDFVLSCCSTADFSFCIKSGRNSKTAGVIGQVLSICLLLNMDNLGRLLLSYKIRTKKKSLRELLLRWKNWQMIDWIIQENIDSI